MDCRVDEMVMLIAVELTCSERAYSRGLNDVVGESGARDRFHWFWTADPDRYGDSDGCAAVVVLCCAHPKGKYLSFRRF